MQNAKSECKLQGFYNGSKMVTKCHFVCFHESCFFCQLFGKGTLSAFFKINVRKFSGINGNTSAKEILSGLQASIFLNMSFCIL